MTTTLSRAAISRDPIILACEIIKEFEGYRSAVYPCPTGVWTCRTSQGRNWIKGEIAV